VTSAKVFSKKYRINLLVKCLLYGRLGRTANIKEFGNKRIKKRNHSFYEKITIN
jgi:hypothetical protein